MNYLPYSSGQYVVTIVVKLVLGVGTGNSRSGRLPPIRQCAHADIAAGLAEVLGRPVTFVDVAPVDLQAYLLQTGMAPWQTEGLLEGYARYHRGEAATGADGIRQATGQAPRDFATFAQEYAPAFR